MYSDADLYIVDDALSAVDAHVSKEIFQRVLSKNGLLKGKTVVFALNQLHLLSHCDTVVVIKSGRIAEQGSLFFFCLVFVP